MNKKSKQSEIIKRRTLCANLYYERDIESWTKQSFYTEYNKHLIEKKLINSKLSDNTIYRDCIASGISFYKSSKIPNPKDIYKEFGKNFGKYIRQIRCTCKNYDKIILGQDNAQEDINMKKINKILNPIVKAYNGEKKTITDTTLVHLYFVYTVKGIEGRLCEIIDSHSALNQDFLYYNTFNYCTEIVFEYKDIKNYKDKICSICSGMY